MEQVWQWLAIMTPQKLEKMIETHQQRFGSLWECNHKTIQFYMEMYPQLQSIEIDNSGICMFLVNMVFAAQDKSS